MSDDKKMTYAELVKDKDSAMDNDQLWVMCDNPPPAKWVEKHPTIKKKVNGQMVPLESLAADKVRLMMKRLFKVWDEEIVSVYAHFNSVTVVIQLTLTHPFTGRQFVVDGIGAAPMKTDSGAGAADMSKIKNDAVQTGVGAAKTYAFKNACKTFGRLFGAGLQDDDYEAFTPTIFNTPAPLPPPPVQETQNNKLEF